jgi:hypothetical protein
MVALAGAVYLLGWHPRTLHWSNLGKIETGMTEIEVERLLGGPPGDYGTGIRSAIRRLFRENQRAKDAGASNWWSNRGVLTVRFDDSGRAVDRCYVQREPE